jgi:hypothetical protein
VTEKSSKESVGYSKGMPHSHCGPLLRRDTGYCKHFELKFRGEPYKQGSCEIVEGSINPSMWCKKFSRAK